VSGEALWRGSPVPGARVAGYRLDEQIGRGGMAVVYRAYDLHLDRQATARPPIPPWSRADAPR
jgi:serine/threonine protein kinase